MLARVIITDWEPGVAQSRVELSLVSETMTLRDFLRRRLAAELAGDRARLTRWCIAAGPTERALNGGPRLFGPHPAMPDDPPDPVEAGLLAVERAFAARGFVVLFDGSQIGDLDQRLTVRDHSQATFIRLVPLQGG